MSLAMCGTSFAQTSAGILATQGNSSTATAPVAYVYVTLGVAGAGENQIAGYAAAADGKLSAIAGSPFQDNVENLAVNRNYLFATNKAGNQIDSYRIEDGGLLHYAITTTVARPDNPNELGPMFFDHTGTSLYDMEFNGSGYGNNVYKSLSVEKPVGNLDVVGASTANSWLSNSAVFVASNVYAYSASCLQDMYWGIFGFKRSSDGLLAEVNITANPPAAPDNYFYCPSLTAADAANHIVISMQPVNQTTFAPDRPPLLATYIADNKGNLSTASTKDNMPETSVVSVTSLGMSPSANLLAVSGTGGLQVFHFNAGKQITHYTGLLTNDEVDQVSWDNQNHLYAISTTTGKLFVFTVTPTGYAQAPGSPYRVAAPQSIAVQAE